MFTTKKFLSVPVLAVMCAFVGTFSVAMADDCTVVYDCNNGVEGDLVSIDAQDNFMARFGAVICAAPDEGQVFDYWQTEDGSSVHGGQLYDCVGDEVKLFAQWRERTDEEISCEDFAGNYVKSGATACDTPCTAGHYCPGGADTVIRNNNTDQGIYECAPGYMAGDGQSSCEQCPEHYFAAGSGASSCELCLGTVNADHTTCDNSNLGGPVTCAAGEYLAAGDATCTNCPYGYFCPQSGSFPTLASVNQGAYSCLPGGATNSDRESCRVILDRDQLLSGFATGEDCWLKPIENDEYRNCMFESVYHFN